jgi:hypothetical protein
MLPSTSMRCGNRSGRESYMQSKYYLALRRKPMFQVAARRCIAALVLVAIALAGMATLPASAQTTECVDEPLLEFFDADDDGVLSVAEIRTADPDNVELQELADRTESEGISGLQYSGCDPDEETGIDVSGGTGESGDPESDTAQGLGVADAESGVAAPVDPDGSDSAADDSDGRFGSVLLIVGIGGLLLLIGAVALRFRNAP